MESTIASLDSRITALESSSSGDKDEETE